MRSPLMHRLGIAALVGAAGALPLAAQQATTVPKTATGGLMTYTGVLSRSAIGIVVDTRNGPTDSVGARVESVTPGGPAARGGIRAGDIITHLNGQALILPTPAGSGTVHLRQAHPAVRLMLISARFQPRDTVTVQFRRGQATRTARVVTEPERDITVWRHEFVPGPTNTTQARQLLERQRIEQLAPAMERSPVQLNELPSRSMFIMSDLAQLQLAPLNAELGQYFGTTTGVLVISAPKESGLRLRGGDVIIRIDGRSPSSPLHVIRILSSYGDGEEIRLDILRSRKRETLTGTLAHSP
jgi:S1-C subfamily serine protease